MTDSDKCPRCGVELLDAPREVPGTRTTTCQWLCGTKRHTHPQLSEPCLIISRECLKGQLAQRDAELAKLWLIVRPLAGWLPKVHVGGPIGARCAFCACAWPCAAPEMEFDTSRHDPACIWRLAREAAEAAKEPPCSPSP